MADTVDDLFLFGDDFEAILALLENDEPVEEQCSVTVGQLDLCLPWGQTKPTLILPTGDILELDNETRRKAWNWAENVNGNGRL